MQLIPHQPKHPSSNLEPGLPLLIGTSTGGRSFLGPELEDPFGLLEGTGKFMRHVKIRPGQAVDSGALEALVAAAYTGFCERLRHGPDNSLPTNPLSGSS